MYLFLDKDDKVIYVGKAINLKSRVSSYFIKSTTLTGKTQHLVKRIKKIKVIIVESELEALLLEAFYIKKFNPYYNVRFMDDKTYIRIRITLRHEYPSLILARSNIKEKDDPHSIYFGPYTNSMSVKLVLKTIRKIYPYSSVLNHQKGICLYNHLGLCPCPPVFNSSKARFAYRNNIKNIIKILEGKSRLILKDLENKRDLLSGKENYEEAKIYQSKIDALSHILQPRHLPFEYHSNPNLHTDLVKDALGMLYQELVKQNTKISKLTRIECFDISNIQGAYATGSMVVFINGEKHSSKYKRFKIKKDGLPNDFRMIQEVIDRRIKHLDDWGIPDLIIVDGGKGQVSAGLKALSENKIFIPIIGLAKREETIIIPEYIDTNMELVKLNYRSLLLSKNSLALKLLMRIRDEAHRFAIKYHRNLRSKGALI